MAREREHAEQCALFRWAWHNVNTYPDLAFMFAIPNGGHRHKTVAAKLKAEGVRAGVPDICLPVPRGDYKGLYLELKAGDNKPTLAQKQWLEYLGRVGYLATWCTGWEAARDVIVNYLNLEAA
jgi:hypothetical protein